MAANSRRLSILTASEVDAARADLERKAQRVLQLGYSSHALDAAGLYPARGAEVSGAAAPGRTGVYLPAGSGRPGRLR
jgi:hypothetical protein